MDEILKQEYLAAMARNEAMPTPSQNPEQEMLAMWQVDAKEEINELKKRWQGYELNDENKWVLKNTPVINQKGINDLLILVNEVVGRVTTYTELSDEYIRLFCEKAMKSLAKKIGANRKEYELNQVNMDEVLMTINNTITCALNKARNALMIKAQRSNTKETVIHTDNPQINMKNAMGGVRVLLKN